MVEVEAGRIAIVDRFGADDLVESVVGASDVGVELEHDALTAYGPDEGRVDVAAFHPSGHVLEGLLLSVGQGFAQRRLP